MHCLGLPFIINFVYNGCHYHLCLCYTYAIAFLFLKLLNVYTLLWGEGNKMHVCKSFVFYIISEYINAIQNTATVCITAASRL